MPWVVDLLAGVLLAILLYWLVRFRMLVAPIMRDKYGKWARWSTWFVVILAMVAVANLELAVLRQVLHSQFGISSALVHEMLFAVIALLGGYFLVSRHVTSKPPSDCMGKNTKTEESE